MAYWTKSRLRCVKPEQPTLDDLFSGPAVLLGLGFGAGLAPKAPGTFGTAAAIPLYLILAGFDLAIYLSALVAISIVGVWICSKTAARLQCHDHPAIVWDEIAGFLLTMLAMPLSLINIIIGFVLFRFFDILKPWPIKWIDRNVHGGVGIMLDDLLAGAFAWLVLFLLNRSNPLSLFAGN